MKKVLSIITLLLAVLSASSPAMASADFTLDGITIVVKSYHITDGGNHAHTADGKRYFEDNRAVGFRWKNQGSGYITSASLTEVLNDSFSHPALYGVAFHHLGSTGPVSWDMGAGIALGYQHDEPLAKRLDGLLPVFGIQATIYKHVVLDFIPAGIVAGRGTNMLSLSWKIDLDH